MPPYAGTPAIAAFLDGSERSTPGNRVTVPRTARNSSTRKTAAMPMPRTALRPISRKCAFPVTPPSIRRCAPANVMYPPTVPPSSVSAAGKSAAGFADGRNVFFSASNRGGRVRIAVTRITRIISTPRIRTTRSATVRAFLNRKITIAESPASTQPTVSGMPNSALKPSAPPPTLPMLNASPPSAISAASAYPSPFSSRFATSCPRRPEQHSTRQMFSCAIADTTSEIRMTNPKLGPSEAVNVAVCVRKPGPTAEVAIRNAAPISAPRPVCLSVVRFPCICVPAFRLLYCAVSNRSTTVSSTYSGFCSFSFA